MLEEKKMYIEKIHTDENGSNMMTKCLSREKLEVCKQKPNLVVPPLEIEGEICGVFHSSGTPNSNPAEGKKPAKG